MPHVHVCLLPTEILLDIFTIIRDDKAFIWMHPSRDYSTIAALARTCRAFKEPALDVLWKNMDRLKPLISCLPEGVKVATNGEMSLRRPPFAEEWMIFSQYAYRIHSLTIYYAGLDEMSDLVAEALAFAQSSVMLPNLRTLEWLDDRDSFLPLLRTLLVPTITSVTLTTRLWLPWKPSFSKSAVLASLRSRCPSIRKLHCVYGDSCEISDTVSNTVSEAVRGYHELVHLTTGVLDAQALTHLASLPSLKSLCFLLSHRTVDDIPPANSISTFTSKLDEVSITALSYPHLTWCFRNVRFMSCRSVVLSIYSSFIKPYHPPHIPDLIISLSECFSPVLEQLCVQSRFDDEDESALNDHRLAFGFNVIAPLLQFSRLTKLDLDWLCTSDVDDEAFKDMVQSWPLLEEFYFGSRNPWLVPPSLTFIGLIHLIQHCRNLYYVAIRFAACPIDADSELFSATLPNERIALLFVGTSPIVNPMVVASQLHALLPNLTNVMRFQEAEEYELPFEEEWDRMDECLRVLTKGAELHEKISKVLEDSEEG
ncbi:hypothetical protein K503DRAFT_769843 [Rhizopogon vinicolor AM-OR11-026]|uniref:F-box domain-containing protein n=1 Tax=Rhizopogon vinicolor AM-OR11-026 TaxID=1314800 RepID=A0A1B7N2K1_9AGAM|nr:hypothetical protein K503DRAFT_769843 [Rhizopogon vinicolor AM-OR11-026]